MRQIHLDYIAAGADIITTNNYGIIRKDLAKDGIEMKYVEAEPERTYICTCYGICDIEAKAAPSIKETVKTKHHESPRFVCALGANQLITKALMKNHTDTELIMLERMVWRQPPFVSSSTRRGSGGNGGY